MPKSTYPEPSAHQRKVLGMRSAVIASAIPEWSILEKKLLGIDGILVVPPIFEAVNEDLIWLVTMLGKHGMLSEHKRVEMRPMQANACHFNAMELHKSEPTKYGFASGFAMTKDDGLWRGHSWCMIGDDVLVETTIERELYFGIVIND